jgi:hypothetical protein
LSLVLSLVLLASLVLYSIAASQPLFYLVALGRAQRSLGAPAYIELRQALNPVMMRRVPLIYLATLGVLALTLVLASRSGEMLVAGVSASALSCLVVDLVLMTRASVPINSIIDGWTAENHPADWDAYRREWFTIFGRRQSVLVAGWLTLLAGSAFRP